MRDKKAQVWVETAIYTLIGITIIAILLATLNPQINKMKDRAVVEQTIEAMNILDSKISEVSEGAGSVGVVKFTIGKGKLEIDGVNSRIRYHLDNTNLQFSQAGSEIKQGNIYVNTTKVGSNYNIDLTLYYNNTLNFTNVNQKNVRTLQTSTTPYQISIQNMGDNLPNQNTHLDFSLLN